ncbi:gas vesicle protein GvpA/GvpJ/GvpM family [Halohasta litchfieldiae]|jgi:hypothetical protein|uniref:Gas vesicle protein n=1 Tax=Halohasta litchfieldiae TaxID=1073996 RepID=A0A1H6T8P6_9EURY|nr:gas vesicle protein GvpA/GvpJ/GvpM family [Halohasta litchfieldiae]SEI75646.1 Gas vesicle protein [Halohasta litchfieldiae]
MEPTAESEDVIVDLLDVLLQKGVVLEADVVIGIADIPLVGIKLRAAIAGLTTMREYGMFEEWDLQQRRQRRSHALQPGGSLTGRPNPQRPREEAQTRGGRPEGSSRPRHGDRSAGSRRPAGSPAEEESVTGEDKGVLDRSGDTDREK